MDTVFALASARGKAGVAVMRISGPRAWEAAARLAGDLPPPRRLGLRVLKDAAGDEVDQALVACFEEGASFTGEPVVELSLHGSIATVDSVLRQLEKMEGLRLAEAGEFTRRALMNGCLDLAQVEGLADLIEAETEAQRKQAYRVLSGSIGRRAERWRDRLVRAASLIEASIDFSDEDVPDGLDQATIADLAALAEELEAEAEAGKCAERVREGFEVAIIGRPNVGKSTLLNTLAGRDAAITSEIAGTTRDVVEVRMDLAGLPVTFLDTAGLREAADQVEQLGVARALERARAADLRIALRESDETLPLALDSDDIIVRAKADLGPGGGAGVSGLTGAGVDDLVVQIGEVLRTRASGAGVTIRARHREALRKASVALDRAVTRLAEDGAPVEIVAADLREALRALDSLVGRVDVEDLLGEIFASFCIGK